MIQRSSLETQAKESVPTVLLLEDDNDWVCLAVAVHRRAHDGELIIARNGKEGLRTLETLLSENRKPILILIDLRMPEMDGIEFLARLRNRDELADVRRVVLTSSLEIEDLARAIELGADEILEKPLRVQQLKEQLGTLGRSGTKPIWSKRRQSV